MAETKKNKENKMFALRRREERHHSEKLEQFWLDHGDQIKNILGFFFITAAAFGYFFLMLMLISFVTLSIIHFTIQAILTISVVGTVVVDVFYIVKKIKQYRSEGSV